MKLIIVKFTLLLSLVVTTENLIAADLPNVCFPDSVGSEVIDIDGHCLNASRSAWNQEPFFNLQLLPWYRVTEIATGFSHIDLRRPETYPSSECCTIELLASDVIYGALAGGPLSWNDYIYSHLGEPVQLGLDVYPDPRFHSTYPNNRNDIVFLHDPDRPLSVTTQFRDLCGSLSAIACHLSRKGSILTNAHGGFSLRLESDIFVNGAFRYAVPPLSSTCIQHQHIFPRNLLSVLAHEVGHALGVGHQEEPGGQPRAVMDNDLCQNSTVAPQPEEHSDLDFLTQLINPFGRTRISSPPDGTTINFLSQALVFAGVITDPSGNTVDTQLEWLSSIQGILGEGEVLDGITLIPGTHIITLRAAQDNDPNRSNQGKLYTDDPVNFSLYNSNTTSLRPPLGSDKLVETNLGFGGSQGLSQITVNVTGPVTEEFFLEDNPCFIQSGQSTCSTNLHWTITGELPFAGELVILDSNDNIVGSGRTGNSLVSIAEGAHEFRSVFRANGTDHLLGEITAVAGEVSGTITSPGECEIDPPETDCPITVALDGLVEETVILYDASTNSTVFEFSPNGIFQSTVTIRVPAVGTELHLYSERISSENLLDSRSITTFRNADQYEFDGFVADIGTLDTANALEPLYVNGVQANHNFHKDNDIDFVRIPHPPNTGSLSLRTFNVSDTLNTDLEIGCMKYVQTNAETGWTYVPLTDNFQGVVSDGLESGSVNMVWPSGVIPSTCGGNYFVAKVTRQSGVTGIDLTYDLRLLNGADDLYEPDNQIAEARPILLGESQEHNFNRDNNDWISFAANDQAEYEVIINSVGPNVRPCIDSYINGTVESSQCQTQGDSSVVLSFTGSASNTFKVTNALGVRAGTDYTVTIRRTGGVFTGAVSGSWFNASRDGEGFVIEVLNGGRVGLYWFTYPPVGESGDQRWLLGVGQRNGNQFTFDDVRITRGARFGDDFDPDDVIREHWGTIDISFSDDNNAVLTYSGPPSYGSGTLPITLLSRFEPGAVSGTLPAGISGSWSDPATDGEGWSIQVINDNQAIVVWYTYDNAGNQAWSGGVAQISNDSLVLNNAPRTSGTNFGDDFNSDDVVRTTFGDMIFTFSDCNTGTMTYTTTLGNGTRNLQRITSLAGTGCSSF